MSQIHLSVETTQILMIDRRHSLGEVAEALQYFGEGHVRGKVIIILALSELRLREDVSNGLLKKCVI
jgi:hypothetical protein